MEREYTAKAVHRIIQVSPELAKQWLNRSYDWRHARSGERISQYANDMLHGRWHLTADAIKFGKSKLLFDGHQRLHAVIKARTVVPMLVWYNVPVPPHLKKERGLTLPKPKERR